MEANDASENHAQLENPNFIVDFENAEDSTDPRNWSTALKWAIVIVLSSVNTVANFATVLCLPAVPQILQDFHSSHNLYSVILASAWEGGEAVGPLMTAPLSEIFGRSVVYNTTNILFILFSVGCALSSNPSMLVAFRFLNGMSDASIALNASIAGDLFVQEKRGFPIAILSFPPLLGPVLGPVVGGYLTEAAGWRWAFWLSAIAGGALELTFLLVFKETYAPHILRKKAHKIRKETGDTRFRSKFDFSVDKTQTQIIVEGFLRPARMFPKPVVLTLTMQVSFAYGVLYILLTTITTVFQGQYGFSQGEAGLAFLGLSIGMVLGVIFCAFTLDRLLLHHQRKTGTIRPENRLIPMAVGAILFPLGLFIYGWTVQYRVFYVIPMIGTASVGFCFFINSIPIQAYFVDVFKHYAASAIAATVVIRCIVGTVLPLAAPALYANLGLGWGNSLLGFLAIAFIPVPIAVMHFGQRPRAKDELA